MVQQWLADTQINEEPVDETPFTSQVMKIWTYDQNDITDNYTFIAQWSAVLYDDSTILTNAHVLLDDDLEPTGLYEVCQTSDPALKPECFSTATLIAYDKKLDLAVLTLDQSISTPPVSISELELDFGDMVTVLGYPGNWGNTITQTEGQISGFDKTNYKVDVTIDNGSSWGWAFNGSGKFIGIPKAISQWATTLTQIIPMSVIQEFMWSLDTQTQYDGELDSAFSQIAEQIRTAINTTDAITTDYLSIPDVMQYGLEVQDAMVDKDWELLVYLMSNDDEWLIVLLNTVYTYGEVDKEIVRQSQEKTAEYIAEGYSLTMIGTGEETIEVVEYSGFQWDPDSLVVNLSKSDIDSTSYTIISAKWYESEIEEAKRLFVEESLYDEAIEYDQWTQFVLWDLQSEIPSDIMFVKSLDLIWNYEISVVYNTPNVSISSFQYGEVDQSQLDTITLEMATTESTESKTAKANGVLVEDVLDTNPNGVTYYKQVFDQQIFGTIQYSMYSHVADEDTAQVFIFNIVYDKVDEIEVQATAQAWMDSVVLAWALPFKVDSEE